MTLETALAQALARPRRAPRSEQDLPPHAIAEACRSSRRSFDWDAYFAARGHRRACRPSTSTSPEFFEGLDELVAETPLRELEHLPRPGALIARAGRALPKAFVDESFAFDAKRLTGAKETAPRWKKCVAATDSDLGEALGQRFVEPTLRRRRQGATQRDGRAHRGRPSTRDLDTLAWMDAADTKAGAARSSRRVATRSATPTSGATTTALADRRAARSSATAGGRAPSRRSAIWRRSASRVDRGEWVHDAADGERLLRAAAQRDRLPRRHPAAAVLQHGRRPTR